MDRTDVLAVEAENKRERLAAELLASDAHGTTAERVEAFVERGGRAPARFTWQEPEVRSRRTEKKSYHHAPPGGCIFEHDL